MEVINEKTLGVLSPRQNRRGAYIFFSSEFITISKLAAKECGIKTGDKINFVSDYDRLYFYIDDNPEGLSLKPNRTVFRVYSIGAVSVLFKKYSHIFRKQTKFGIRPSVTTVNDKQLVEVLIHNKQK
jgi:hypothetical protein